MAPVRSFKSIGLDLGKKVDPAAACELTKRGEGCATLTNCRQLPLNVTWPKLCAVLVPILQSADIVMVDAAGLGSVMVDYLRQECPHVWGVVTTSGKKRTPHLEVSSKTVYIPKAVMVEDLIADVEKGRLEVLEVGDYKTLLQEMSHLERKQTGRSTTVKYEAKSGHHDDLVMALALARMGFMFGITTRLEEKR